jgi:hypothetical protein
VLAGSEVRKMSITLRSSLTKTRLQNCGRDACASLRLEAKELNLFEEPHKDLGARQKQPAGGRTYEQNS